MKITTIDHSPPLLLREKELLRVLGLPRTSFQRLKAEGKFPVKPVKLSPGTIAYPFDEVQAYIEQKKAERAEKE